MSTQTSANLTSISIDEFDEFDLPRDWGKNFCFDEKMFSMSFDEEENSEEVFLDKVEIFKHLEMISSNHQESIDNATNYFMSCTKSYKRTVNLLLVEEFVETIAMIINDSDKNDSYNRPFSVLLILQSVLHNEDVRGSFLNALNLPLSIEKYLTNTDHPNLTCVVIGIFIIIIYYEKRSPKSSGESSVKYFSIDPVESKGLPGNPEVACAPTSAIRKSSNVIFSSKILARCLVNILQESKVDSLVGITTKLLKYILQYDRDEIFIANLKENAEFNFIPYFLNISMEGGKVKESLILSHFENQSIFLRLFDDFYSMVLKSRSPWMRDYVEDNFISILLYAINICPSIYQNYSIISEVSCFIKNFIKKYSDTKANDIKIFLTGNVDLISNMVVYLTESVASRNYNYISNIASIFTTLLDLIEADSIRYIKMTAQTKDFAILLNLLLDDSTHNYLIDNISLCDSIKRCLSLIQLIGLLSMANSEPCMSYLQRTLDKYASNTDSDDI